MVALSLALHGAAWASMARLRPAPPHERIEIEVVEHARPRPPPAAPPPAAERPRPARPEVALARALPPPPLASAPPAPPPAPGAPKPLPRVGISLGSTVASGAFAVGVGNTLYGKASEEAADPQAVRPLAPVPAARLSAMPRPIDVPRIEYPPDARKAGVEGQVVLALRLDERGAVTAVRVVEAPSPALAAAAAEAARRFRFTPGLRDGEPVATEIRYTCTFYLE